MGTSPVHRSIPPGTEKVENDTKGLYFFLFTDASNVGSSGVLCIGKNWWSARPAGFWSHKFDTTESRWSTYKQELSAPVNALDHFKDIVKHHHVVLVTDNESVSKLPHQKELNEDQEKAYRAICQYDHEIQWIEGQCNIAADALSRQYEDGFPKNEEPAACFTFQEEENEPRVFSALTRPQRARKAPSGLADYVTTPRRPLVQAKGIVTGEMQAINTDKLGLAIPPDEIETEADGSSQPSEMLTDDLIDLSDEYDESNAFSGEQKRRHPPAQTQRAGSAHAYLAQNGSSHEFPLSQRQGTAERRELYNEQAPDGLLNSASEPSQAERKRARHNARVEELRRGEAWEQPKEQETELSPQWQNEFEKAMFSAYSKDSTFRKVLEDLPAFDNEYRLDGHTLYYIDGEDGDRLCIPNGAFAPEGSAPRSFK
ncbi:hypothetical protein JCM11641_002237, partial [Rhodosporidiobolus odoratus]